MLEFDHVDRTTKRADISKLFAGAADALIQAELRKCQLLCRPCHRAKSRAAGDVGVSRPMQHGRIWGYYHHRCRCEPCVKAAEERNRRRRRGSRPSSSKPAGRPEPRHNTGGVANAGLCNELLTRLNAGSIPVAPTYIDVSASVIPAGIAQLEERFTRNEEVLGSIPSAGLWRAANDPIDRSYRYDTVRS